MNNQNNPIEIFREWYKRELSFSKVQIPTAVCLSTIGLDNFPNARFVSFKGIVDDTFVVTGPLNSRKGMEIAKNHNVALTFWWTETECQVRIQGKAKLISEQLAHHYFNSRSTNSKAVTAVCKQGEVIEDLELLKQQVSDKISDDDIIKRPKDWGGYAINPVRIELMEFNKTRFHRRLLFENIDSNWISKQIQP